MAPPDGEATTDSTSLPAVPDNNIDVASILKEGYQRAQAGIGSALGQVNAALKAATGAEQGAETAAKQESEAEIQKNTVDAQATLQRQADNKEAATLLGTLPGLQSEVLTKVARTALDKEINSVIPMQEDLEARRGVGLLDNPLQFMWNSFVIPYKERALKQAQEDVGQRLGVTQQLQARTTEAFQQNATVDVANATQQLDALNKASLAKASKAIADSQEKLAQLGMQSANIMLATSVDSFSALLGLNNAVIANQRLGIERSSLELNRDYKNIREGEFKIITEEKSKKDTDIASFESKLGPAASALGLKGISSITDFQNLSNPMKDILRRTMAVGEIGTPGQLGLTPADALSALEKAGTIGGSPGQALVANKLKEYAASAQLDVNGHPNVLYAQAKPDQKLAMEDDVIKRKVQEEAKNIPMQGGIYSPLPLKGITSINPVIQALPLVKDLAPLAINEQMPTDPNQILEMANQRIAGGKSTPESEAAQVAAVFKANIAAINSLRQYGRMALPGLTTERYNMTVDNGYGRKQVLNMADPVAVKTFLLQKAIAATREKEYQNQFGVMMQTAP